ncbi:hypothetical protein PInf_004920 [Phytophthora infestans]|nr:hypothetical protein PInf_004920 [Phytophthora infestans]
MSVTVWCTAWSEVASLARWYSDRASLVRSCSEVVLVARSCLEVVLLGKAWQALSDLNTASLQAEWPARLGKALSDLDTASLLAESMDRLDKVSWVQVLKVPASEKALLARAWWALGLAVQ